MTLSNMNISIDDLVACKPTRGDVPFFDGSCWRYDMINQTAQEVLDCMIGEILGLDSHGITIGITNDLEIILGTIQQITVTLVGTVLTVGDYQFDLAQFLNTSYFISDGECNYEIFNHQKLSWVGLDGLHFNVGGGDIEVGLPTPVAQYFTPGRCITGATPAFYSGNQAGITTPVTIVCDTGGSRGNSVNLQFGPATTIAQAITAWNMISINTVSLVTGDDTQIPGDGVILVFSHGADANTCLEGDYAPNNQWLVLTRDCITNQAQWMPPQCCLQQISFTNGGLEITTGSRDNTTSYCGTCSSTHQGGGSCHCHGPIPLPSINTDNQQLSLTIDPGVEELLCLTRRHGGTRGIQIPDPDSCVDLIEINSHELDLQGNLLYLLGSDLLVNDVVDLGHVNRHTIFLTSDPIDPLHYHDPLFPRHYTLDIIGCDLIINNSQDLNQVAQEALSIEGRNICVNKQNSLGTSCISCMNQCIDIGFMQFDCNDIEQCICNHLVDRVAEGVPADLHDYVDAEGNHIAVETLAAWHDFFAQPRSVCNMRLFITTIISTIQHSIIEINKWLSRQKFRAKISMRNPLSDISGQSNQVLRAAHDDVAGDHSDPTNQRWFIPYFDESRGRHGSAYSMVADPLGDGTLRPTHNKISVCSGANGIIAIPDVAFSQQIGVRYDETHSSALCMGDDEDSQFCRFGANTITCVKTGYYNVSLQGVFQIDHSVKAIRYSVIKYNAANGKLDIILDSKFGAGSVGSSSLCNPLIPMTNEYHMGGTKIILLEAGDIVFPAVKISPQTTRPKFQGETVNLPTPPGGTTTARDILYKLNDVVPAFGIHGGGSYTPDPDYPGSFTPGAISRNYSVADGGYNVAADELPWIPSSLPNITPHFFAPSGGENGAEAYGLNLGFPGGGALYNEYRYDDGCVTLYGPSGRDNSDGLGATAGKSEGASLVVYRVNARQMDDPDYIPMP